MNIIEKIKKIEINKQNILSLRKENEQIDKSIGETQFKVKVESVAFDCEMAYKGDTVKVYSTWKDYIKLTYKDVCKMFSRSELELLFEEVK